MRPCARCGGDVQPAPVRPWGRMVRPRQYCDACLTPEQLRNRQRQDRRNAEADARRRGAPPPLPIVKPPPPPRPATRTEIRADDPPAPRLEFPPLPRGNVTTLPANPLDRDRAIRARLAAADRPKPRPRLPAVRRRRIRVTVTCDRCDRRDEYTVDVLAAHADGVRDAAYVMESMMHGHPVAVTAGVAR